MINEPGDEYEREADAVADKVMRMHANEQPFFLPGPVSILRLQRKCKGCAEEEKLQMKKDEEKSIQLKTISNFTIQRKCAACEEEEMELHRKESDNLSDTTVSPAVEQTLQSAGQPMEESTRSFMEQSFGYDFGDVQIHNDSLAHQSSADINALAYTHDNHVVFAAGQYQPGSEEGKKLMAHELTHVLQQNHNTIRKKNLSKDPPKNFHSDATIHKPTLSNIVQCAFSFAPVPRPRGSKIHGTVLPSFSEFNKNLFVEVKIPGATKKDVDSDKVGVADFYISTPTNDKQRTIGIRFNGENPAFLEKDGKLEYHGANYDHAEDSAPRGAETKPSIRKIDDAPTEILLGDLKPAVSAETIFGGDQLTNYSTGISNTAAKVNKYLAADNTQSDSVKIPKTVSWSVHTSKISSLAIPAYLEYPTGKGISIGKLGVYNGEEMKLDDSGLVGSMFVYKDFEHAGIWSYEWIPKDIPEFSGNKDVQDVLGRLNKTVIPFLSKKPDTRIQRKETPPKFDYGQWDKESFAPWKSDADKIIKTEEYKKEGSIFEALTELNDRIPSGKFPVKPEIASVAKGHKKIELWDKYGSGFGKLRKVFGPFFNTIMSVLGKISSKVKAFFSKNKSEDEEVGGDSIIKKVAKDAFIVIKKFVAVIFQRVADGMKESLIKGIKNIIKELFVETLGEDFLSSFEEIKQVIQDIENFKEGSFLGPIEDWIEDSLGIVQLVDEVKSFLSDVDSIVSKVKWAVRALQCISPPVEGCLKLFFSALTDDFVNLAISSCWFQEEVYLPIFNALKFLKQIPDKIIKELVDTANSIIPLPSFIKSPLFADPPSIDTTIVSEDLNCNDEKRINKINLAFAKLEDKYSKEKVRLLLEVLKHRGIGEGTELDLKAIDLLDKALHELESVNDATLMEIADQTQNPDTPVLALEEFIQNVQQYDKNLFELSDVGFKLDQWFFVAHPPLGSDGKISVTISDKKSCKQWNPLMKIRVKAVQKATERIKGKSRKLNFESLETIQFDLGGHKTIEKGQKFWGYSPDSCDKLKIKTK